MYYVYLITNTVNGKKYVGQTKQLRERIRQHVGYVTGGCYHIKGMSSDFRECGVENMDIKILGVCDNRKDALIEEALMIFKYDSHINGYNTQLSKSYLGEWKRCNKSKKDVWVDTISKIEMSRKSPVSVKISFNENNKLNISY